MGSRRKLGTDYSKLLRGNATMRFMVRWFLTGLMIVTILLLWWFPTPMVYLVEEPNYALDYENQYSIPTRTHSFGLSQETLRHSRPYVTLSSYILGQMENRPLFLIDESQWNSLVLPEEGVLYVRLDHSAFRSITISPGLLQLRDTRGFFLLRYRSISAAEYDRHELPNALRYPLRTYGLWILAFGLGGMTLVFRMPVDTRMSGSSIAPTAAVIALLFSLSIGLVSWPFLYGVLTSDMSYASMFIGGFLFLSLGIGLLFLRSYMKMMDDFFSLRGVLVHWHFSAKEWQPIGRARLQSKQTSQNLAWLLLTLLTLLLCGAFAVTIANPLSFVALAGTIVLSAIWRILLHIAWKRQKDLEGLQYADIYIGRDGLYCAGDVHCWKGLFARFVSADLQEGNPSKLQISYETLHAHSMGGRGIPWLYWNRFSVDVPIPRGKEEEAQELRRKLNAFHGIPSGNPNLSR